ncbi:MAG: hydrogenase iron-sulfur subunit [Proteobacteria bacterium]|nr:hydrogenase iron-sulfur subunit [Pseudomonadota bacterium]
MEKVVPKIGLFIWDQGGRIARVIDLDALVKKISKPKNVKRCEVWNNLWESAFFDSVREDLKAGLIDRFLWVGRFTALQQKRLENEFSSSGLNPYLHNWCDLEEQGVCMEGVNPDVRNRKALLLVKMALARTRLLEPLDPVELPSSDAVLIVGAGIAGLQTAVSLSELGKRVFLVEKKSGVGGKVALLSRFYPRLCDPHCGLQFAVDRLAGSDLVEIHTCSTITSIDGSPGNFTVQVEKQPRYINEELCNTCGACVAACPVTINGAPHFSEDQSPEASGLKGICEALQQRRKAVHPATPMAFPSAFVIERENCPPGCRECGNACPTGAVELDQTSMEVEIRVGAVIVTTGWDPYPVSRLEEYGYDRYANVVSNLEMERLLANGNLQNAPFAGLALNDFKNIGFIQCVGSRDERHLKYCSSVCCSATLKQVLNFKELVPDASCTVFYQHMRSTGFEEELYRKTREIGDVVFLRDRPASVEADENTGKLDVTVLDPLLDKKIRMQFDLLVLAGGMCPSEGTHEIMQTFDLPKNQFGFPESHHQCHPEESQRTGIYVGGCAREPMNVTQSIESSHRAAMKALNFLQGTVMVDPCYPVLDKTKCDVCKRCMEDCPYSAFEFDEKGIPFPNLTKCRQCGICMGVCPLAAISLQHCTIKQMAAQVEAINTGFMGKSEPVILVFLCENDAYKAAQAAVDKGLPVPPNVITMKVPCAGAVNNGIIADALSFGIDGVLIAGCKDGQCHYVRGNQLVEKRSGDLSDKLKQMMMEPERVRSECIEIRDSRRYIELLESYVDDLKAMGPNPFKI